MDTFKLQRVQHMPRELEPGVFYFSEEFEVAGHLCPCGCENKVITPIGPTEWSLVIRKERPTLYPSIGNWQIPCRSHYWIREGQVKWSYQWSEEQIAAGRKKEEKRRKKYYNDKKHTSGWDMFKPLLNRLARKKRK